MFETATCVALHNCLCSTILCTSLWAKIKNPLHSPLGRTNRARLCPFLFRRHHLQPFIVFRVPPRFPTRAPLSVSHRAPPERGRNFFQHGFIIGARVGRHDFVDHDAGVHDAPREIFPTR